MPTEPLSNTKPDGAESDDPPALAPVISEPPPPDALALDRQAWDRDIAWMVREMTASERQYYGIGLNKGMK